MYPDERLLSEYAKLVVRCGVNLQKGQSLIVRNAPVRRPELAEAIAVEAYRAGAPLVEVLWSSDRLTRGRFENAPEGSFSNHSGWLSRGVLEALRGGAALVHILSSDPELFRGIDPKAVATMVTSAAQSEKEFNRLRMSFEIQWNIVSVPTPEWARRVYPDKSEEAAERALWDDLLGFCRVADGDSVRRWEDHVRTIERRKRIMTERSFRELRFKAPGTDLVVGLPAHQRWDGGQARTSSGLLISPNIPTEEIFTMPHRERVDGTVRATRTVHYDGLEIQDLEVRFEKGIAVEASASTGQEQIDRIIATDAGASRLGEVALVSHDTPIARAARSYHNDLIDENAASHLAFGRAYRDCIENGASMSDEEFERNGGNSSDIHIDFMIGSESMEVIGISPDGTRELVIEGGVWRLER